MTESNTNPNGLSDKQLDLLLAARDLDDAVVIEQETLSRVKQLLGDVLEANHQLRDGAALPLTAQLDQLESDGNVDDVLGRQQHPETGGASPDDFDESGADESTDPVAALRSHENPTEIKRMLSKADAFERNDRLPNHTESLRAEAAAELGCDVDDLAEIDRPSDPTLV